MRSLQIKNREGHIVVKLYFSHTGRLLPDSWIRPEIKEIDDDKTDISEMIHEINTPEIPGEDDNPSPQDIMGRKHIEP